MSLSLHGLSFPGAMLARGFWLYVWEVTTCDGRVILYVGRTGDNSSANAQSPINRLSQHLGTNRHANALKRQLLKVGISPEACSSLEMIACGPILPEMETLEEHTPSRNIVAALEKRLRDALHQAGYDVLNEVNCHQKLDEEHWKLVRIQFARRFPKLNQIPTKGTL